MDWFVKWFNLDYLRLYAHRDRAAACREAAWTAGRLEELGIDRGPMLDIGCGNGRHLEYLKTHFSPAFGIDLSTDLLGAADSSLLSGVQPATLLCADMRALPFGDRSFRLITSFFTSFGYFADDSAHEVLLQEWKRVLEPNGVLVLDYLNRSAAQRSLKERTERVVDGRTIIERRSFTADGLRLVKDIEISHGLDSCSYQESVRVYTRAEVEALLRAAGFSIAACFGDFTGEPHSDTSKRLLIFARAGA